MVDSFLEDDIMLTMEQAKELLQKTQRRQKRKLAEPLTKRWSLPIPYAFDGAHSKWTIFGTIIGLLFLAYTDFGNLNFNIKHFTTVFVFNFYYILICIMCQLVNSQS